MIDEMARRRWLLPPASGVVGGIDLSLLDPTDEDDRHLLILAEHPDLAEVIDTDQDEIELDGVTMSPRLHLAMHEVVANQIWNDDPPEMWQTAQRLTRAGHDRHEVLHMLASGQHRPLQRDVGHGAVEHGSHPWGTCCPA